LTSYIAHTLRWGTALALTAAATPAATAQAAATLAPKVTSSFTPSLIGVGNSTALGITISNPNASTTLSNIAFTDTLPGTLAVDNPNGESGTCGSTATITATPGSRTFSLTGGSLKGAASCTISISVTANEPEVVANDTGPVTSSGPATPSSEQVLTVLAAPTVTVTGLKNNAKLNYGQTVRVRFSCGQAYYALGLQDCSAQDDAGNAIADGGKLGTRSPGRHQLLVSATSIDGLVTTDTFNYTVLPDNSFTLSHLTPTASGGLTFKLALPGAGTVRAIEAGGRTTVASVAVTVKRRKTLTITVRPKRAAQLKATLTVTFTPKGGVARTITRRGIATP
jgi:hypothetical protein